jgi:hypothetical protein
MKSLDSRPQATATMWGNRVVTMIGNSTQMVAALDRQLAPGGDGMAFGCLTQLATSIAPELIGLQTELREWRVVGCAPERGTIAHPTEQFNPVDRLFHART